MTDNQTIETRLQHHYSHGTLAAAVDKSLVALGKDPAAITVEDLAPIDEFHIGGRPASVALFEQCAFTAGMHLLDVGSGLGGPARACAAVIGATVIGVDLTDEYVAVARQLSGRLGLGSKTTFQKGSVLDLPFADATFDGAYMIHVGMNIADKPRLFHEVRRSLKPGAVFGIYDVMRLADGELRFPLPWSSVAGTSFVEPPASYRDKLAAAGFAITAKRNRHAAALEFFAQGARREQAGQAPALFHRAPDWPLKSANLQAMLVAGIIAPVEIIARAI